MNNDLISREALKEAIIETFGIYFDGTYDNRKILKLIDNAQPVEIPCNQIIWEQGYECGKNERPQGEWKYHKGDRLFLPYMECSNCKVQDSLGKLTKKEYREVNHFCFNCGAKMKGGAE